MSLWMILGLTLLVGSLVAWVLLPLWQSAPGSKPADPWPEGLEDPWKVQQLIDLEYDYQTGKVSHDEYVRQKQEIMRS